MTWNNLAEKTEVKEQEPKTNILFKNLSEAKQNRGIKILSYGNFSTGKTHFALSSDKPVYIIDTENGASPLANKFPDAKILNIYECNENELNEKDDIRNLEKFQDVVNYLILNDEPKTIIVDSVSDIWEWSQAYAKTKIFKIPIENRFQQQWDWQVPNKIYLTQIRKLINKNCDIIFVARSGEEYAGAGQPIGKYKPQCQKKTPYWVDIVLEHNIKFINKQLIFSAEVKKCRQNEKIIGKIIENPSLNKIKELLEEKK